MDLSQGEKVGTYEIVAPIGRGGMATVYKAYHERLDRHVAVKLMHTTFLQDDDFHARFQREARIVARLEHPAIVPIYDYDEHNKIPYLVMRFVDGMTLKKHYIKKGMTIQEIESTMTKIAEGLDYAHEQGILHRDMKPSNILIDNSGQPFITDFGLARIAEAGASTISHDMMLGTPFYISPEQAQGSKDLDNRTDVYSLGVILYELLTGQVPFQADTPYAIVHGHIYTQPELPSKVNPDLTPAIDRVLVRALEKDRDNRYPNAIAMMRDFSKAITGEALQPHNKTNHIDNSATVLEPSHRINAKPVAPQAREVVENPIPSAKNDFDVDMGDISWDNIREGFRSGVNSLAEMIEERIDTELRERRGIALTEEELARRRVMKRRKERQEFVGHLSTYIGVNAVLIAIWFFTGVGFFWPFFPLFFWGMSLASQGFQYYNKYGPGAARRESNIEDEVNQELGRMSHIETRIDKSKGKNSRLSTEFGDAQYGTVRLNDEGELTDSFIEEQRSGQ